MQPVVRSVGLPLIRARVPDELSSNGLARNFNCDYNLVLCEVFMYNSVATFGLKTRHRIPWELVFGNLYGVESAGLLGEQQSTQDGGYSINWWSDDPSIAPLTGGNSYPSAGFFGQAPGTGTATGEMSTQYCQAQSGGTNNVNPIVQISSIAFNPASLSAGGGTTTATVQLSVPINPSSAQSVTVSLSTFSSMPSSNNVSYQAPQVVPITSATASPISVTFTVNASSSSTQGTVVTQADLSGASSGLAIKAPNATSNYQATLTITP
jgi:hypothetical protein